jgi:hypothetical protein
MAQNIKFSYCYRDGRNYKSHGYLIFANPTDVALTELAALIQSKVVDETWFYAKDWLLPDLKLNSFDYDIDPTWHEFESVAYTEELPNTTIALNEIIVAIKEYH